MIIFFIRLGFWFGIFKSTKKKYFINTPDIFVKKPDKQEKDVIKKMKQLWQAVDLALYKWTLHRRLRRIIIEGRKTRPPFSEINFDESDVR